MTPEQFADVRPAYPSLRAMHRDHPELTWHAIWTLSQEAAPLVPAFHEGTTAPAVEITECPLPKACEVKRYILTSAQNNTRIHSEFWHNLQAYARYVKADVMVARYTYNRSAYEFRKGDSPKSKRENSLAKAWDPSIPSWCFRDNRVELAPGLEFCGELDILPTAVNPLSGLDEYTRQASGIVPHAKMAMVSVPTMKHEPTKFMYTTGTVTRMNYVGRKAGQKAEFHHVFGALIVEVDEYGNWWARQIIGDENGNFHDLDTLVTQGEVVPNTYVEAVVLGDLHAEKVDLQVFASTMDMIRQLAPDNVILHDLVDFGAISPHERGKAGDTYKRWCEGTHCLSDSFRSAVELLDILGRNYHGPVHIIDSNHDRWLERWLDEADYRRDPANATLFLRLQLERYNALQRAEKGSLLSKALNFDMEGLSFVGEDDSLRIAGIECGLHGDRGSNGSRGSARSLSKIGPPTFTGHTHSAGIIGGCWTVGLTAKLDMGYNKGPSSWSHTHGIIYPNGKRCLVTIPVKCKGKWRA